MKKLAAAAIVLAAFTATPAEAAGVYPDNSAKWQINVPAPPGWGPFALAQCRTVTKTKADQLYFARYHYFVVERCVWSGAYFRSTIRYWR